MVETLGWALREVLRKAHAAVSSPSINMNLNRDNDGWIMDGWMMCRTGEVSQASAASLIK